MLCVLIEPRFIAGKIRTVFLDFRGKKSISVWLLGNHHGYKICTVMCCYKVSMICSVKYDAVQTPHYIVSKAMWNDVVSVYTRQYSHRHMCCMPGYVLSGHYGMAGICEVTHCLRGHDCALFY